MKVQYTRLFLKLSNTHVTEVQYIKFY